jgi:pilus assembly protein Flp/PilA
MKARILSWLRRASDEAGQTMVEYAIVAALIAVVAMVAVEALGTGISGVFTKIANEISSV